MPVQPDAVVSTTQPETTTLEFGVAFEPSAGESIAPASVLSPLAPGPATQADRPSARAVVRLGTIAVARSASARPIRRQTTSVMDVAELAILSACGGCYVTMLRWRRR